MSSSYCHGRAFLMCNTRMTSMAAMRGSSRYKSDSNWDHRQLGVAEDVVQSEEREMVVSSGFS